jgi:hypothetical protein
LLASTIGAATAIGSLVVPTWAGATELALSAVKISSAEREDNNIDTVIIAVKRPVWMA